MCFRLIREKLLIFSLSPAFCWNSGKEILGLFLVNYSFFKTAHKAKVDVLLYLSLQRMKSL